MNDLINQYAGEVAKTYEGLLKDLLEVFGFDISDLSEENLSRVTRVTIGSYHNNMLDHWYIDGVYVFSITGVYEIIEPDKDDISCKLLTNYKVEIFEDMIGELYETD